MLYSREYAAEAVNTIALALKERISQHHVASAPRINYVETPGKDISFGEIYAIVDELQQTALHCLSNDMDPDTTHVLLANILKNSGVNGWHNTPVRKVDLPSYLESRMEWPGVQLLGYEDLDHLLEAVDSGIVISYDVMLTMISRLCFYAERNLEGIAFLDAMEDPVSPIQLVEIRDFGTITVDRIKSVAGRRVERLLNDIRHRFFGLPEWEVFDDAKVRFGKLEEHIRKQGGELVPWLAYHGLHNITGQSPLAILKGKEAPSLIPEIHAMANAAYEAVISAADALEARIPAAGEYVRAYLSTLSEAMGELVSLKALTPATDLQR